MDFSLLAKIAPDLLPLAEKWLPMLLSSPQAREFASDVMQVVVKHLATSTSPAPLKFPVQTGPNMPTSGPSGTFTS
jgi:hypothetical protein